MRLVGDLVRDQMPNRSGIAGRRLRRAMRRRDEEFGNVVVSRLGLVPIKERLDGALQFSGGRTESANGLIDELQPEVQFIEIGDIADGMAEPERLARPVVDGVDVDKPDVERQERPPRRERRIDVGQGLLGELLRRASPDRDDVAANLGPDDGAGVAANMSVRQRVGLVPVADEAAHAGDPFGALDIDDERAAAAEITARPARIDGGARLRHALFHHDHADGCCPPVRKEQRPGHHGTRVGALAAEVRGIRPFVDEHQDTRPGVRPDLGIIEGARCLLPPGAVQRPDGGVVAGPGIVVADQIETDRRADHVRLVHEVPVILVSSLEKIFERETLKIRLIGKNVHRDTCFDNIKGDHVIYRPILQVKQFIQRNEIP